MIYFSKFSDFVIESGKRVLKVLQFGAKSADECLPFGIDSVPIKGMATIYAETSNDAESVILGVINESQEAEAGETRFYSMAANKIVKSTVYLKKDGTIEFNGNTYSMVRFEPLKTGLQNSDTALNAELVKIQTALTGLGAIYTHVPVVTNIDLSKSEKNKIG